MKHLYKIALVVLFLLGNRAFAQTDLTLYNMENVPQSMYQNPAFIPHTKVNIGLPVISSIYLHGQNTGFKWKHLVTNDTLGSDSLILTMDNALDKMSQLNFLGAKAEIDLLSFGFKAGKGYFSFNATEHIGAKFAYPRDLFGLAWKGNGGYLGQSADFSGLGFDASHYREFGIGYAREINDKLTIGGKVKFLHGMANIYTKKSDLSLFTDAETFDLTANSEILLQTSGIGLFSDSSDIDVSSYLFKQKNFGAGIDLGASYQINEDFRVTGSIVDLGFIRWKSDPRQYFSQAASFTFSGIDIADFPTGGVDNAFIDSLGQVLIDSLEGTFVIDSNVNPYSAPTVPRLYLGGDYFITDKIKTGVLFKGELYHGTFLPSVAAHITARVKRFFQASLNFSYTDRSAPNMGFGFAVNGGPVQLYLVSDNVLSPLMPHNTKNAHVHMGLNLTFGREVLDRDGDGIMDKEDDCPDTPGLVEFQGCPDTDADGIPDPRDACPTIPGVPEHQGCPDTDADGVVDSLDACPTVPGKVELAGCPDRDGDGIIDSEDACPDEPGPKTTQGCPDRDGDGVIDKEDLCPDKPGDAEHKGCPDTDGDGLYDNEDRCVNDFGPKDNFGCPYGDLDGDGVLDKDDRCPDTAGPRENVGCPYGDLDGDGVTDNEDDCPNVPGLKENKGCPQLTKEEQEILDFAFQNLEFESGKDIIRATSYESLDSLGKLMVKHPEWFLRVSGHTDNVGNDAANMKLSEKRAKAVVVYLVNRGAKNEQFRPEWFGETKPLYPNTTPEGRQKNRRVEMKVEFE